MLPLITLLTDFGTQDAYVGVMKGVMAQICPGAQVVDLTHAIPPQDLAAARFNLLNAVPYFPAHTVHLAVVDPGVGTPRRAIALQLPSGSHCVGPDNGLLSGLVAAYPDCRAVELTNPDYWRDASPSFTFHGRDIFAPVAAHLARGVPIAHLGPPRPLESLVRLPFLPARRESQDIQGSIQYIDHFGNLITTIPAAWVEGQRWTLGIGHLTLGSGQTYGSLPPQQLGALVGSHGWIEIAVNGGHAQRVLQAAVGDSLRVHLG